MVNLISAVLVREGIAICRHCGKRLELVPGKVQKQFCNDTCRKAYKRAELKAVAVPSVAEPRTDGTKPISDNAGQCDTPDVIPKQFSPAFLGYQRHTFATGSRVKPKRGKDIKYFEDLSPSIQRVIDVMSDDKTEHKRRTAIAINYQHQFPDRYHSTGI